jgi:amidase
MAISINDYVAHDATALAVMIRAGDVTAREVTDAAIARAEAVNPKINAIAQALFDQAVDHASAPPSGLFAGVPFSIKDLNHPVAGACLTHGSRAFTDNIQSEDGEAVRRFRHAGLNPICISTSAEFGLSVTTESSHFGPTRNPWDLARSSGGSSGGAAALVASGVMPMAHATDGGGSIRVPASCCGLFGLKVSRGRTPIGHGKTEGWNGLTASFAVTRSVRDAAHLLDAVHGPELGARSIAQPPRIAFARAIETPPSGLRIALSRVSPAGLPVDPACVEAVDHTARLLLDMGHIVEEAVPDLAILELALGMQRVTASHTAALIDARVRDIGGPIGADLLEPVTAMMVDAGRKVTATELIAADQAFMRAAITMARFQQHYDVILTPTLAQPPASLGHVSLAIDPAQYAARFIAYCPFTAIANQTGQPAMSMPLHWSIDGLPIGVQFLARIGEEELLLSLAADLERAAPWAHRCPEFTNGQETGPKHIRG